MQQCQILFDVLVVGDNEGRITQVLDNSTLADIASSDSCKEVCIGTETADVIG